MPADASAFRDGLSPYAIVTRMVGNADRLRDLAADAEERGRIADATRATLAESKTLHDLLSLGVQGQEQIEYAEDASALEAAVVALVRRAPVAGEFIAADLEARGRDVLAGKVRALAERWRAVSGNEPRQELTDADR